jgi:hypothetical protein
MVLVYPLVLGLLLAPLLGGDLRRLGDLRLRGVWLLYLALALQLVAFPVRALPVRVGDSGAVALWLVSYGCLAVAGALNLRRPGLPLVAAGMVANVLAIVANGGHMPVLPEAMHAAGHAYEIHLNSVATATPQLAWLVDRWAAPRWIPSANFFSVGDVLIGLGGFVFPLAATGVGLPFRGRARAASRREAVSRVL